MAQMSNARKELDLELTNMKRNPYLVDYQEYRQKAGKGRTREVQSNRRGLHAVQSTTKLETQRRPEHRMPSTQQAQPMKRKKQQKHMRKLAICLMVCCIFVGVLAFTLQTLQKMETLGNTEAQNTNNALGNFMSDLTSEKIQGLSASTFAKHPTWTEDFLTISEYSRPGEPLKEVNNIFVHYTANQGTSAAQNRSYFEQLKDTHERGASAHFIIGYEGEIIQCIPLDEIGYAVQTRNEDSISIECCYTAEDGSFTQETYDSLILLLRWLTDTYGLDPEEDVLRHYDCGGKKCPIYYTENEDAWEKLKSDI